MSNIKNFVTGAVLVLATCIAGATTLTFDDLAAVPGTGFYSIGDRYVSGDFEIKGTPSSPAPSYGFAVFETSNLNWTGSAGLTYFDVGAQIELSSLSGNNFGLTSIDISRGDSNLGLIPVAFQGVKEDGSTVWQVYTFSNALLGNVETLFFDSSFQDLTRLIWNQGAEWHQFDNIAIFNRVPEPSSVLLLAMALPLLAFILRRRRVSAASPRPLQG